MACPSYRAWGVRQDLFRAIERLRRACVEECFIRSWTVEGVQDWLQHLGFDRAVLVAFEQQHIRGQDLLYLSREDVRSVLRLPASKQQRVARQLGAIRLLCRSHDVPHWGEEDVASWLAAMDMADLRDLLAGVNGRRLLELGDADLKKLGVGSFVRRQEALDAIRELHSTLVVIRETTKEASTRSW
jgi:hypothetical protein